MSRAFAVVLSMFLLIEGVWGLMSNVVFGFLTTNTNHAIVHIVLGVLGLVAGVPRNPGLYNTLVGLLLIVSGVLYFVPGANAWLVNTCNMNSAVAFFNIGLGVVALLAATTSRRVVVAR